MSGRLIVGIVASMALAACTTPDNPSHLGAYHVDTNGDGTGDTFRWPASRIPVRYWVDPRGNMGALVQNAIDVWQDQFMYGEYRGVIVSDSAHADVQVTWSDVVPPAVSPDPGPPVKACGGLTATDSVVGNRIAGAFHSSINILSGSATPAQVEACVVRTVIHELGHSLGMLTDLSDPSDSADIMYFTPLVSLPSAADRTTMQILYHTTPTLLPPLR